VQLRDKFKKKNFFSVYFFSVLERQPICFCTKLHCWHIFGIDIAVLEDIKTDGFDGLKMSKLVVFVLSTLFFNFFLRLLKKESIRRQNRDL
jgi:hypothetical protein